jgi:hypothetical protein
MSIFQFAMASIFGRRSLQKQPLLQQTYFLLKKGCKFTITNYYFENTQLMESIGVCCFKTINLLSLKSKKLLMKPNKVLLLFAAFALLLFTNMKCKKDDQNPIDQLPAATQTGANTFGCLVNGQLFLPKGVLFGPPFLTSYYQYLNRSNATGNYFNVSGTKKDNNINETVSINLEALNLVQGQKYTLKNYPNVGEAFAQYFTVDLQANINSYVTNNIFNGELYISKFDETKGIVSGTFWFDAVNSKGEKVEVREGRFDVHL